MPDRKCYQKGDGCPPPTPGVPRLYMMKYCPFSARAKFTLQYKKVPHEICYVALRESRPEWLLEKNSSGSVPVLEYDGKIVLDSVGIMKYVDQTFDGPKLLPQENSEDEQQKILDEWGKIVSALHKSFYEKFANKEVWEDVVKGMENMAEKLGDQDYFGGSSVGLADLAMLPHAIMAGVWAQLGELASPLPDKLQAWKNRVEGLVCTTGGDYPCSEEELVKFNKHYQECDGKNVDYSMGCEN